MMLGIALVAGGYLLGSVACAIIVCRIMGLPDPREGGSGNPGATNVLRLGGKKAAAMTLLGDVLKGVIPVSVGHLLEQGPAILAATALAAFLGHLFPVFFRFQGGKGVATAFGSIAALTWPVALGMGVVWLAVALATRYASLSSILAAVAGPALAGLLGAGPAAVVALIAMGALLVWRHHGNIVRLREGTENRIGGREKA